MIVWIGFIWFRRGTSCWLLWTDYWTFRYRKIWRIYWLPDEVL